MIVSTPERAPVFVKRQLPPELSTSNPEDRRMAMLYRRDLEFAVGHGVGVHVEKAPGGWDRAVEIATSVIPTFEVERMEARVKLLEEELRGGINLAKFYGPKKEDE